MFLFTPLTLLINLFHFFLYIQLLLSLSLWYGVYINRINRIQHEYHTKAQQHQFSSGGCMLFCWLGWLCKGSAVIVYIIFLVIYFPIHFVASMSGGRLLYNKKRVVGKRKEGSEGYGV